MGDTLARPEPRMPMDALHDEVSTRLRRLRQRYTSSRRGLVDELRKIERPLTIAELEERGIGQSTSSLYRNLAVFEQAGAVRRLQGADDVARFELAEDLTGKHHHHLVCTSCGTIEDIELTAKVEKVLHAVADEAAEHGFRAESHRFELLGVCGSCD